MKIFFRIIKDKLYAIERETLGFSVDEPMYIPDDYLKNQKFLVMRTCHGLGDWALLSSMPRLLKTKYPNSKVYVPTKTLLTKIFGDALKTWGYGTFDAGDVVSAIFSNNPYVDDFVDEFNDEVFHDHYRIFDNNNDEIPLVEQMLKFWQFKDEEMIDTTPDFYPTKDELDWFDNFNKDTEYGYILASSTFGESTTKANKMIDKIKGHKSDMLWYYYGEESVKESCFDFLNNVVEVKPLKLTIRQQQVLKMKASVNYGNETGMNLWTAKYSKTYILGNTHYGPLHFGNWKNKVRKRPFKSGNYVNKIIYL